MSHMFSVYGYFEYPLMLFRATLTILNILCVSLMLSNVFLNSLYCGIANGSARSKSLKGSHGTTWL